MRKTATFPTKFYISPQKFKLGDSESENLIGKKKAAGLVEHKIPPSVILREREEQNKKVGPRKRANAYNGDNRGAVT